MREVQDKYRFQVTWQPFFLRPNMPPEGIEKPPNSASNRRVSPHLKAAGESVGIDFTGKADRYPNTAKSHILLDITRSDPAVQDKVSEALFKAYFTNGSILRDDDLVAIGESVGLTRPAILAAFQDKSKQTEVHNKAASWSRKGVNGVPMFYMNGQRTFSGAQDKDAFIQAFGMAERFPPADSGST